MVSTHPRLRVTRSLESSSNTAHIAGSANSSSNGNVSGIGVGVTGGNDALFDGGGCPGGETPSGLGS